MLGDLYFGTGKKRYMASASSISAARSPLYKSLFAQVVTALLLGIVLGIVAPAFAVGLKFFSDAFLKLITMVVAPIVIGVPDAGLAPRVAGIA